MATTWGSPPGPTVVSVPRCVSTMNALSASESSWGVRDMAVDGTPEPADMDRREIEDAYRAIQEAFCAAIEEVDGESTFGADQWGRDGGGGGLTRILSGYGHIEKAA